MFLRKLFDATVEPACAYCENGLTTQDGASILCEKQGIVLPSYHCRKYIYDPLKRVPHPMPHLAEYDASDFEL